MGYEWADDPRPRADQSWRAENHGDKLEGIIRDDADVDTQYGATRVLTVEEAVTGEMYALWISPVNLRDQIDTLEPHVGDGIYVEYVGDRPTKNRYPMKLFRVGVERHGNGAA